jgi:hypothetical protein
VIDDEIRRQLEVFAQCAHVLPGAKTRVYFRVIDGVEARIGSINWVEKWEQVDTAENASQVAVKQCSQFAEAAAGQTINVSDELDLILQGCSQVVWPGVG